jgi:hypothetical protein
VIKCGKRIKQQTTFDGRKRQRRCMLSLTVLPFLDRGMNTCFRSDIHIHRCRGVVLMLLLFDMTSLLRQWHSGTRSHRARLSNIPIDRFRSREKENKFQKMLENSQKNLNVIWTHFWNLLHTRNITMHRHECNTHNFLFDLENQTRIFPMLYFL